MCADPVRQLLVAGSFSRSLATALAMVRGRGGSLFGLSACTPPPFGRRRIRDSCLGNARELCVVEQAARKGGGAKGLTPQVS